MLTWFNELNTILGNLLNSVISVLPDSPFQTLVQNQAVSEIIGYVNWFIPINFILTSLSAWVSAIAVYYIWQVLLRWLKAIE